MRINQRKCFEGIWRQARLEKLLCGHLTKSFSATANSQALFLEHKNSDFRKKVLGERQTETEKMPEKQIPGLRHTFTPPPQY